MKFRLVMLAFTFSIVMCVCGLNAQTTSSPTVPRLVNFSGTALDEVGKPIQGIAGITLSIYSEQAGGVPLWSETQNVTADSKGKFTVKLGATQTEGLPLEAFGAGEARWVGVRVNSGEEQRRVMLLSVPYALKAADAETLGGLPASAFALAGAMAASHGVDSNVSAGPSGSVVTPALAGTGTANFVPLWLDSAGTLGNSVLFQSGSGSTAKVGVNTTAPASTLDINGTSIMRGLFTLPATGNATATAGTNSQPQRLTASAFSSGTSAAVNQNFQWQAEPAGNNTAAPTGTLNLLFGSGTGAPAETGLKVNNKGQITFAAGQAFPGTGPGTVKSVGLSAPASDFTVTNSPILSSGTLTFNWTVPPTNLATPNSIAKRDAYGGFYANYLYVTDPFGTNTTISGSSSDGTGVYGATATNLGVFGNATSYGTGVDGQSASGVGVLGHSGSYYGIIGITDTGFAGVEGFSGGASGYGVYGTSFNGYGLYGTSRNNAGVSGQGATGVYGYSQDGNALNAYTPGTNTTLLASNGGGAYAAWFNGNVEVDGTLSKSSGSFKIDHPLDPANKYLYHSFVESPDMMNIYNGNVTTDAQGKAVVELPEWFEALNRDFRYQLTVMGQFAQAIVAGKVSNHRFTIRTDKPNAEVSWQVTGVRQDAWANAHRIPVEEMKNEQERGSYLHPDLFGAPAEKSVIAARHPDATKMWKASRESKPLTVQAPVAAPK